MTLVREVHIGPVFQVSFQTNSREQRVGKLVGFRGFLLLVSPSLATIFWRLLLAIPPEWSH